jgi:translation elongation factor EF-Tu-like GTPase
MSITIESRGRRHYLVGNTYPIKDAIRSAGCKWDGDAKAWYSGKRETVEQLMAKLANAPTAPEQEREAPGTSAKVAGRAKYQGKTYYIAGRVVRGRTRYDDTVAAVESRDGSSMLLLFRDGSKSFWAKTADVEVLKTYQRPTTIAKLQEFAADPQGAVREQYKRRGWDGVVGSSSYYTSGLYDEES